MRKLIGPGVISQHVQFKPRRRDHPSYKNNNNTLQLTTNVANDRDLYEDSVSSGRRFRMQIVRLKQNYQVDNEER